MKRFRLYYDKDLEEAWLQEMDAAGWALQSFCLGVYTFVPCEKGKYTYWLELRHKDAQAQADYEALLQESGMEVVERWFYWIYLRRETAKGPFTLYSDPASKAGQYRRIRGLFLAGLLLELLCFGMEVASALETGEPAFWRFQGCCWPLCLPLPGSYINAPGRSKGWRWAWNNEKRRLWARQAAGFIVDPFPAAGRDAPGDGPMEAAFAAGAAASPSGSREEKRSP